MFAARSSSIGPSGAIGAFALRRIMAGEVIHVLAGRSVSRADMLAEVAGAQVRTFDDPLQVGDDEFLLLDPASIAFNHGCAPNALLRGRSELFARRTIEADEEILYDYAATVPSHNHWFMDLACACGASSCRRVIGNILTVPPRVRALYRADGGLQRYIRADLDRPGVHLERPRVFARRHIRAIRLRLGI